MAADDTVVTLLVRGEGGDVFPMDLPPEGSFARENFETFVSKGWLEVKGRVTGYDADGAPIVEPLDAEGVTAVIAGPEDEAAEGGESGLVVPEGNVDDVLAWVHGNDLEAAPADGWQVRAVAAIELEQAADKPRKGIVDPLEAALDADAGTEA